MERRDFLKALGIGAAAAVVPNIFAKKVFAGEEQTKPNIVLILVDDLGYADVGCYAKEFGNDYYETPNIDTLRSAGMKFTDAYAACAVCSPTRYSVMSGCYPARSGITDWIGASNPTDREMLCPTNESHMKLEQVTIPEILKTVGYTTCHIGKWHLGGSNYHPDKQGFDHNIGGCHWGHPWGGYFSPYNFPADAGLPDGPQGEYLTDREAEEAVNFIETAKASSRPFFLYMSHYTVHRPTQGKEDIVAKYQAKPKPAGYESLKPAYAAMIESLDDSVGQILGKLKELGIEDNTVVMFTSDNGGMAADTINGPLRGGKGEPWEGGIREPFIVKWPGVVSANSLSDEPIISADLLPTICDMAGAKVPADSKIDGKSIVPVLKYQRKLESRSLFWHFPHYRGGYLPYSILRDGKWKLIKSYGGDKEFQLFDLESDVGETTDLALSKPDKVRELNEKLAVWLRQTNARMPVKNPNYVGTHAEKKEIDIG